MSHPCEGLCRFLDGALSANEQSAFRAHLVDCEACSTAFQESLQLELLAQMALERPPAPPAPASASPAARLGPAGGRQTARARNP